MRELDSVGYTILPEFVSLDKAAALRHATLSIPVFKHLSDFGGDEGMFVSHVHNLLGKTRAFDELVLHPAMLDIAEQHLGTEDIQLNITGMLDTVPGQRGQRFHRDDSSWPIADPHQPLVVNFMIALDPFDEEVGGTKIVPASHRRKGPVNEQVAAAEAITMTMPAGALLAWTGALWHAGGGNSSTHRSRRALNFNFVLNWLRQEENQTLCVPHDVVLGMAPRLQQLLGYTEGAWSLDFRPPLEVIKENVHAGRFHPGVQTDVEKSRSSRFVGVAYAAVARL